MIGHIEGVRVGQIFPDRRALHDANVHQGLRQGIAPDGSLIILSGGYVDDLDEGDSILYTGEGQRDPNTGRQIGHQTLTRGNRALVQQYQNGNPVRVNRGSRSESKYAPASGYRYDGLYRIDTYWNEQGIDGFNVWRYHLVRLEGQPPIGEVESTPSIPHGSDQPLRGTTIISRVIRNTQLGNSVKELYNYKCQICGASLKTPSGPYAECCHIKPLGRPHNGPDTLENILCLCPNCHVLLDMYALSIQNDMYIPETGKKLTLRSDHIISSDYLTYRRQLGRRN